MFIPKDLIAQRPLGAAQREGRELLLVTSSDALATSRQNKLKKYKYTVLYILIQVTTLQKNLGLLHLLNKILATFKGNQFLVQKYKAQATSQFETK